MLKNRERKAIVNEIQKKALLVFIAVNFFKTYVQIMFHAIKEDLEFITVTEIVSVAVEKIQLSNVHSW